MRRRRTPQQSGPWGSLHTARAACRSWTWRLQGTMHISDHRTDVTGRVAVVGEMLHRLDKRLIPVDRVALVARVDLLAAAFWQAHVLEVNELAHTLVQGEPMHS